MVIFVPFYLVSFFLLFLYTYANFLIKNGQVEDREGDKGEKNSAPSRCTPSETRERDRDGRGEKRQQVGLSSYGLGER